MIDRRLFLGGALLSGVTPAIASAETRQAAEELRLRTDWPWLGRYADDNRQLIVSGAKVDIVFMGDSITEGWRNTQPTFFAGGRINRGIGGQTTPQMLLRMMADVIALRPRFLHLMAGTNDIAGNTGPLSTEQTIQNLTAMCQLARANNIKVLLASIPPASHFPWRPGLETIQPIYDINSWARSASKSLRVRYIDYTAVLADPAGAMKPGYASDGVHPTALGYDVMAEMLSPILTKLAV